MGVRRASAKQVRGRRMNDESLQFCRHNAVYNVRIKLAVVDEIRLAKTGDGYCESAGWSALV